MKPVRDMTIGEIEAELKARRQELLIGESHPQHVNVWEEFLPKVLILGPQSYDDIVDMYLLRNPIVPKEQKPNLKDSVHSFVCLNSKQIHPMVKKVRIPCRGLGKSASYGVALVDPQPPHEQRPLPQGTIRCPHCSKLIPPNLQYLVFQDQSLSVGKPGFVSQPDTDLQQAKDATPDYEDSAERAPIDSEDE